MIIILNDDEYQKFLFDTAFSEVDHQRIGEFLGGDMHARLNKRGGSGGDGTNKCVASHLYGFANYH